jgi:hypothetical protein
MRLRSIVVMLEKPRAVEIVHVTCVFVLFVHGLDFGLESADLGVCVADLFAKKNELAVE